ncbi:hypothetical protein E1283_15635 [Streptomyces hainanensis]|uniref:Uncharacterized protein n=1 Tax=Streptomyces hainanensis TaxID=402648 RepID=A0A4R4TB85_9ACTN|nr:hypothetical protein E1283_15635 [Streptomyces hainanensis]
MSDRGIVGVTVIALLSSPSAPAARPAGMPRGRPGGRGGGRRGGGRVGAPPAWAFGCGRGRVTPRSPPRSPRSGGVFLDLEGRRWPVARRAVDARPPLAEERDTRPTSMSKPEMRGKFCSLDAIRYAPDSRRARPRRKSRGTAVHNPARRDRSGLPTVFTPAARSHPQTDTMEKPGRPRGYPPSPPTRPPEENTSPIDRWEAMISPPPGVYPRTA